MGIFGDMFDFNGDGRLDAGEQAMEFMFLDSLTKESGNDSGDNNDSDDDSDDDE